MIYNLEYEVLDSIGRAMKTMHYGVLGTVEDLEEAKQRILRENAEKNIRFKIHVIEDFFNRIARA